MHPAIGQSSVVFCLILVGICDTAAGVTHMHNYQVHANIYNTLRMAHSCWMLFSECYWIMHISAYNNDNSLVITRAEPALSCWVKYTEMARSLYNCLELWCVSERLYEFLYYYMLQMCRTCQCGRYLLWNILVM